MRILDSERRLNILLQSDLGSFGRWATDWQVKFNAKKCGVMSLTHKKDKTEHSYYLSNTLLKSVNSYKDLGINISSDLTWSYRVDLTVIKQKASRILGLLKRKVGCNNMVIMEYALPVWAPYILKDNSTMEKINK